MPTSVTSAERLTHPSVGTCRLVCDHRSKQGVIQTHGTPEPFAITMHESTNGQ
jgi:hypothetical protein